MVSVIELLLETLTDLSVGEFERFKYFLNQTDLHRHFLDIPCWLLIMGDMQYTVFSMVQIYGQQSAEKIKEVLKRMERMDLVQRLSDTCSGAKKKHSVDERLSALIHKVATMAAIKQLLLETLRYLSYSELNKFKWLLQFGFFHRSLPDISWKLMLMTDRTDELVDMIMKMFCQQSVEVTLEVFMDMNRTDLVQRLSETSSGPKAEGSSAEAFGVNTTEKVPVSTEKHSVDEHWPAVTEKVETMASVIELLLETLADLSGGQLKDFIYYVFLSQIQCFSDITVMLLEATDIQVTVILMVQLYGQHSVEKTKEVLKMIERTDLVHRLSDSSSGPKKKPSADEHRSALIQRVATIAAVEQLLLETLNDLSNKELKKFKEFLQWIVSQKDLPYISWTLRHTARAEIVSLMVENYGQQSVELTREVLKKMNRTDMMEKLSKPSSALKKKHSVDEHRPAPFERAAVEQFLLETLKDLSHRELEKFMRLLQFTYFQKSFPQISLSQLNCVKSEDELVRLMVQTCGERTVEVTKEVLMDINRTDLVDRLSETSSRSKVDFQSEWFQKEATMTSLQKKLLETLKDLSYGELEQFKLFLQHKHTKEGLPGIPRHQIEMADRDEIVELMVEIYGQQSVEVTREFLTMMAMDEMMMKWSNPKWSRLKEDEHQPALFKREVTMTSLQEKLLETLEYLSDRDLKKFNRVLQYTNIKEGLPRIPRHRMEMADRVETVELMVEIYGQQSVEVTREVLKKMSRTDLAQKLSDISSGSKGPSRSLELEACGSTVLDSSDWTKLDPKMNSTGADETPTYSLQSEAGNHFECSVSGLRWACKEKVSFRYQFCSWDEPMERMESIKYIPAGPLMDITVIAGRFDDVYLPHWICIDDVPKISDKFAVLHIDDCGDVVEKVSEVTSSHVKLSEPVFSPRAVLMKVGIPVKINCKAMDKMQLSYGYKVIRKPHPEKSLKMRDHFILTADLNGAKISPKDLKLRYESRDPNFFEVYIENPDRNFTLNLAQKDERQPVWTHEIRKDEYQSTDHIQVEEMGAQSSTPGPSDEEHFVDKHQMALIKRVSSISPILDELLFEKVLLQESYGRIRALATSQDKMRELYSGCLKAGGACKDIFYEILERNEPYLIADLKQKK
ncbi:uncharacterized protein LOC123968962 isoform X2 [Micropterus dolomieu]|uniref:uncharacterized protein LOC123968962 isoform X2 n=1 Tax=Micropterus dolomieu TaxID=147949 RepID=UPI001E8D37BB|nr:uncharacterized protein LOC123968962 isoform X2 [Micropterus dolomieu]